MKVLIGHPGGNPNSFNAVLSYFERGNLAGFVIPWLPRPYEIRALSMFPGMTGYVDRVKRRSFSQLMEVPLVEGRVEEWLRMVRRIIIEQLGSSKAIGLISDEANHWVMRKLAEHCADVDAVHSYDDCALGAFEVARCRDKMCIYDMPIAYFRSWERIAKSLAIRYRDWLPKEFTTQVPLERAERKIKEMELADVVLAPSKFVRASILEEFPDKKVKICRYGTDFSHFNMVEKAKRQKEQLRFLYAGHLSIRKGTPLLLDAWEQADLKDAELVLAGSWQLAEGKRARLPRDVIYLGHLSWSKLRNEYQASDVFVFPSFFEGYGLVITEAMASGLPVLCSDATVGPDILDQSFGQIFKSGNVEELTESLRWFSENRGYLPEMGKSARNRVEQLGWERYREQVAEAVASFS